MYLATLTSLLSTYADCADPVVRKHLGMAARRAVDLFTAADCGAPKVVNKYAVTKTEESLGINQGKIAAIKEYRSRTGLGLKESKEAVEEHFTRKGLTFGNSYPSYPN